MPIPPQPSIDPAPVRTAIVQPDKTNLLSSTYEKWFTQIYRALLNLPELFETISQGLDNLLGTATTPGFSFGGTDYFYTSALHLSVPQSALSALAASNPTPGLLVHVTDYNHVLEWFGSGWQWGPGETGSQYVVGLLGDPVDEPWLHPLDGTPGVKFLKFDGTLGVQDLPTTPDQFFRI